MPLDINLLQAINPGKVIATTPGSGGDGGIGDLMSGLEGLAGGVSHAMSRSSVTQQPTESTPFNNSQTYGSHAAISGLQGQQPGGFQSPQQAAQSAMGNQMDLGELSKTPAFQTAYDAHSKAIQSGATSSPVMTVVDYSKPANSPRMWVVDTQQNKVLLNTYVGQGSTPGFSNNPGSHQSSLGTFKTGDVYHSDSMNKDALKIQGMDAGVNDNAFNRGIVVHGGTNIGPDKNGTSWGCFSVPNSVAPTLIGMTKGGTIIHAYAPTPGSLKDFDQSLSHVAKENLNMVLQNNVRQSHPAMQSQQAAQSIPQPDTNVSHIMNGIAHVESGGSSNPYGLVGPSTHGGQALGKYQIMSSNLPTWSKESTGRVVSRDEFMSNPALQDQIAKYQLTKLSQQYKPLDVASVWFSGRPANKAGNAKDSFGTTVPEYQRKFLEGYRGSVEASAEPSKYAPDPNIINPPSVPGYADIVRQLDQGHDSYSQNKQPNALQALGAALSDQAPASPQAIPVQYIDTNNSPDQQIDPNAGQDGINWGILNSNPIRKV